jgi:hypothetical protein
MKDRQHNGQKKKEILIATTSSRISYQLRNINRLLTTYAVSRYLCRLNFHPEHLNSSRVYLWDSCCSICSFLCSVFEIIIGPFIFFLLVQYIVCPSIYGFWLFLWHLRFSSECLCFKITTFILLLTLKYLHHNNYMGFGFT